MIPTLKPFFTAAAVVFTVGWAGAQSYQARQRVYIPKYAEVVRHDKVKDGCDSTIKAGYKLTETQEFTGGKTKYTAEKEEVLTVDRKIKTDKTIPTKMYDDGKKNGLRGWANITVDEKDKSILHVNYWLNPTNTVKAGTKIKEYKSVIGCDGITNPAPLDTTLSEDVEYNLTRVDEKSDDPWFTKANHRIEVLDKDGKVSYYLVNKYDRDADYTIELKNRQYISYTNVSYDLGPITIPLKARFGYKKGAITINSEVEADLNVGIFAGASFGRYRVRYEKPELKELSKIRGTLGVFMGIGRTEIDSVASRGSEAPLKDGEKRSMAVINAGFGATCSIYNVEIGLFLGFDIGAGPYAKSWNFNQRPWLGVGLGYNLGSFWKK